MNEFYQGIIAGVGMLGGLCAFNYWVFNMMEKRLEEKMDKVSGDVRAIAKELQEERKSKDKMYQFVLDSTKK